MHRGEPKDTSAISGNIKVRMSGGFSTTVVFDWCFYQFKKCLWGLQFIKARIPHNDLFVCLTVGLHVVFCYRYAISLPQTSTNRNGKNDMRFSEQSPICHWWHKHIAQGLGDMGKTIITKIYQSISIIITINVRSLFQI